MKHAPLPYAIGDSVFGTFSYESSAPAFIEPISTPNSARYPALSYSLNVGGDTFTGLNNQLFVNNNAGPSDQFGYMAMAIGPAPGTYQPGQMSFVLNNFDGTAFNSTAIPSVPLDLSKFDSMTGQLSFYDFSAPSPPLFVDFSISSLNLPAVAAVPEPSTYALMLAGVGIVGFVARKRRRRESAAA